MGLILRMLGKRPGKSEWERVTEDISRGLEGLRKRWFSALVQGLEEKRKENPAIEVRSANLGGSGELAIIAFQLYTASRFIGRESYVSRKRGTEFADILYPRVTGEKTEEIHKFIERYFEMERKAGHQLYLFCNDLASYITGKEKALEESKIIALTVPGFVAENMALVARSFGDEKTAEKLERNAGK